MLFFSYYPYQFSKIYHIHNMIVGAHHFSSCPCHVSKILIPFVMVITKKYIWQVSNSNSIMPCNCIHKVHSPLCKYFFPSLHKMLSSRIHHHIAACTLQAIPCFNQPFYIKPFTIFFHESLTVISKPFSNVFMHAKYHKTPLFMPCVFSLSKQKNKLYIIYF